MAVQGLRQYGGMAVQGAWQYGSMAEWQYREGGSMAVWQHRERGGSQLDGEEAHNDTIDDPPPPFPLSLPPPMYSSSVAQNLAIWESQSIPVGTGVYMSTPHPKVDRWVQQYSSTQHLKVDRWLQQYTSTPHPPPRH